MGLDRSVLEQLWIYVTDLVEGDLGQSWYTGQSVSRDLLNRAPATLELITIALVISLIVATLVALYATTMGGRTIHRATRSYALVAGAIPEFALGLLFLFVFFTQMSLLPGPVGRGQFAAQAGIARQTGFLVIDSVLQGDMSALIEYTRYLILPVATLVVVAGGPMLKMLFNSVSNVAESGYMQHARASRLRLVDQAKYLLRAGAPPALNLSGSLYGYMLGGAVLVETVFAWGGMGQYVVQAISTSDYAAIQGFVIVAATFVAGVHLTVDVIQRLIDPRLLDEGVAR